MQSKICALLIFSAFFSSAFVRAEEASYLKLDDSELPRMKHNWSGEWRGKMGGQGISEGKNEGAAAAFEFDSRFDFKMSDWVSAHVAPEVELFSSRLQQRFDDDEYQNRVRLDSAYLELKPVRYAFVRGGAISQEALDFDLLISKHRTFPGVQEVFTTDNTPLNVKFMAQQLVPTSYSLNTDRQDKEALPSFQTQSIQFDALLNPVSFGVMGGHYSWSNLPDKVAAESFIVGNSPNNSDSVAGSKFLYNFDGYFWRAGACFCALRPVKVDVMYMGEHNSRAPSEVADGQMWWIRPTWIMGARELSVAYINYFIERDVTVGAYTRSLYGNANRMGDLFEVKYDLKDLGWAIKGQYVNARTVATDPDQQTYTQFNLWVETAYAPF